MGVIREVLLWRRSTAVAAFLPHLAPPGRLV